MPTSKEIFKLKGNSPEHEVVLSISDIGFADTEIVVNIKDTQEINTKDSYEIRGGVVDMTGLEIPSVSVKLEGSKQTVTTDDQGNFTLSLPKNRPQAVLIVNGVGLEEKRVPVSINDTNKIIIKCTALSRGVMEIVVTSAKTFDCFKPKPTDTLTAVIRKAFRKEQFKIYPNPVEMGQAISVDAKKAGIYSIQLFDNNGKFLQAKEFDAVEGATQTSFIIPLSFGAGIYYVRLVDIKTKKQYTDKVVVI